MLGLATTTELRLAFYGVLLAAISGWLIYEHHHLIAEGEATVRAQDAAARAAQKVEDAKTSAGVVDELKAKLAAIPPPKPASNPVLRLCVPTRYVRTQSPTPGAQSTVASAAGTSPGGMPSGTAGIDIGPAVSDLKYAAQVSAIYRDTTWDWAVKQAKP